MKDLRFFMAAGVLFLAGLLGMCSFLPVRFETASEVLMSRFPMVVGQWKGRDIPLTQRDYEILETKNLIMREYYDPAGHALLLYIVYSGDNRKVLHPPEVCYLGSGATIADKSTLDIEGKVLANRMIAELPESRQLVVYWYKAGALNTGKYVDQQFNVLWHRMLGKKTSSAMIRISANIRQGGDTAEAVTVRQFAAELMPLLGEYVP